jgi:hypothetical protein
MDTMEKKEIESIQVSNNNNLPEQEMDLNQFRPRSAYILNQTSEMLAKSSKEESIYSDYLNSISKSVPKDNIPDGKLELSEGNLENIDVVNNNYDFRESKTVKKHEINEEFNMFAREDDKANTIASQLEEWKEYVKVRDQEIIKDTELIEEVIKESLLDFEKYSEDQFVTNWQDEIIHNYKSFQ